MIVISMSCLCFKVLFFVYLKVHWDESMVSVEREEEEKAVTQRKLNQNKIRRATRSRDHEGLTELIP